MDSSDEDKRHDEEMNKMRSSSPSALSTASSGSPLMCGSSSGKRPGPASIAAAQLQCQQRLEFANRLVAVGAGTGAKHGHTNRSLADPSLEGSKKLADSKMTEKSSAKARDGNRSFGYNMAKSIAFKAYRFNEFWSMDKMRYMNLACLLMTLTCLITILLFSGSNSNSISNNTVATAKQHNDILLAARKTNQLVTDEDTTTTSSETFDSLESQPLVRGNSRQTQQAFVSGSNESPFFDDFTPFEDHRRDAKTTLKRKLELPEVNETSGKSSIVVEREVEDSTGIGSNQFGEIDSERQKRHNPKLALDHQLTAEPIQSNSNSLIEPILSQLFNDMELGSLLESIKRSSSSNGTTNKKPVVMKRKNGATIIISSSSSFNESNLNDSSSSLPSLLEKLLPPIFRPISLSGNPQKPSDGNISGNSLASTTITIGSEPIFAASSSLSSPFISPMSSFSRLVNPFALDPFNYHNNRINQPVSQFMEPIGFRSPFGPMFGPSPLAIPQPSLMSMIMRANPIDSDEETGLQLSRASILPQASLTIMTGAQDSNNNNNEGNKVDKNDTLNAQASQNSTIMVAQKRPNSSALQPHQPILTMNDSEVETIDVSHFARPNRLHNIYSRFRPTMLPQASSMLIFSSGNLDAPQEQMSFPLPSGSVGLSSPFMAMQPPEHPQPQMVVVDGDNQGNSPLNPILRTILNNVMSNLVPISEQLDKNNRTERSQQLHAKARASSNNIAPNWTTLTGPDLDGEEWPAGLDNERSDEQQSIQNKHLRARHRDADELDSGGIEASDFMTGLQFDQQTPSSSLASAAVIDRQLGSSGLISGTIRQTIRGPGMTVERIIEVPSDHVQQVDSRTRSQSLSRTGFKETSEPFNNIAHRPIIPMSSIFARPITNDRMSSNEDFSHYHVGNSIGKLLSDISSRRSGNGLNNIGFVGPAPLIKNRSIIVDDGEQDDTDSGEYNLSQSKQSQPIINWPKIRVANARIRMRPISEQGSAAASSSHENIFMLPPTHFTIPDSIENGASSSEDNFNSMEERLNHAISFASHKNSGHQNHKPINDEQAYTNDNSKSSLSPSQASGGAPIRTNPSFSNTVALSTIGRLEPNQANNDNDNNVNKKRQSRPSQLDNPFTSPSSPLFGFPTSATKTDTITTNNNSNNRQQRSFTYHSNNELASSLVSNETPKQNQNKDHSQAVLLDPAIGRARFMPFMEDIPPPASIIMGRRLDDTPFNDQANQHSLQDMLVGQIVSSADLEGRNINDEHRQPAFNPVPAVSQRASNENYRTIVV